MSSLAIPNRNSLATHLAKNLPFYTKEQILFVLNSYQGKPAKAKKQSRLPNSDVIYLVPDYASKNYKGEDKQILLVGEKTRSLTGDFALFNKKHSTDRLLLRFNYYTEFGPAWILSERELLEELVGIVKVAKIELVVVNSDELKSQLSDPSS